VGETPTADLRMAPLAAEQKKTTMKGVVVFAGLSVESEVLEMKEGLAHESKGES